MRCLEVGRGGGGGGMFEHFCRGCSAELQMMTRKAQPLLVQKSTHRRPHWNMQHLLVIWDESKA